MHITPFIIRRVGRDLRMGRARILAGALAVFASVLVFTGCQTARPPEFSEANFSPEKLGKADATSATNSPSLVLREGDVVRVSFPGAPNLNTSQVIRRDGKIALQLIGEFKAAGMTPPEMEKELIKLYGPQLQTKEVTVTLESSGFPVYVTGAVLRPGKVLSDRPLTALEAIMEAGGFDYAKANLKSINVIRRDGNHSEHFTLNLRRALRDGDKEPFTLKPSDIIYVPERFQWF